MTPPTINAFMAKGKPSRHQTQVPPQFSQRALATVKAMTDTDVEQASDIVIRRKAADTSVPFKERYEMLEELGYSHRAITHMISPRSVADIAPKTHGGRVLHHCPKKKHGVDQKRCIKDGCLIQCPECGVFTSAGYGSTCRNCEIKLFTEQKAAQDAAREEAAKRKLADEEKERLAGLNGRKGKPKWTASERELKSQASKARVVTGRVGKERRSVGGRGATRRESAADSPGADDDEGAEIELRNWMDPVLRGKLETVISSWLLENGLDLLI